MMMTTAGLIELSAALLWVVGLTEGRDVDQTPLLWGVQGQSATMNCSHTKDFSYRQMYWYRQLKGETMKLVVFTVAETEPSFEPDFTEESFSTTKPDAYSGTFTVKKVKPKDEGLYFCAVSKLGQGDGSEAYFGKGTKLTVLEPGHDVTEPTVKVFPPSEKECQEEEKVKTIVCVARGFYPDHVGVSWTVNGENVTVGVATDSAALRQEKTYTITSRLRVRFTEDKVFNCTVSFFNGTHTELYSSYIHGKKELRGPLTREKYLRITQTAKLSYGAFIIKSSVYGAFVTFLVWKLQSSAGKQSN